jgi:hypothetical protein
MSNDMKLRNVRILLFAFESLILVISSTIIRMAELKNKELTYFSCFESRHSGWIARKSDRKTEYARPRRESNLDTFACVTLHKIDWPEDGLLCLDTEDVEGDFLATMYHIVDVEQTKDGLKITKLKQVEALYGIGEKMQEKSA